jgi:hypothetical protein
MERLLWLSRAWRVSRMRCESWVNEAGFAAGVCSFSWPCVFTKHRHLLSRKVKKEVGVGAAVPENVAVS